MADKYLHDDGRICTWDSYKEGRWLHWDHDEEPKPSERKLYACMRAHPEPAKHIPEDRGEFGMPGIGLRALVSIQDEQVAALTINGVARKAIDEMTKYPYPDAHHLMVRINSLPTTPEGGRIAGMIAPVMDRFFRNNTKYARAQSTDLGDKGIIPDINRKTSVLVDRIWYGADVVGEPTVEIIDDLIGHLFLLRDKIEPHNEDGEN